MSEIKKKYLSFSDILIGMVWAHSILLQYVRSMFMKLPIIGEYTDIIIILIYIMLSIITLYHYRYNVNKIDLIYFALVVLIYLFNEILCIDNQSQLTSNANTFFLTVFPMFYIGRFLGVSDISLYKLLYKLSLITVILCIGYQSIFAEKMTSIQSLYQGNMDLAYKLLPHCCLVSYIAIQQKKITAIVTSIVGITYLTMLGTRGAVLIMFLFLGSVIVLFSKAKHKTLIAILIVTIVVLILYSPLFLIIIDAMQNVSTKYGLSVRIFSKILSGQMNYDSGRSILQSSVVKAIWQNPLIGYGLYADRTLLGIYAHSLFLELLMQFGILFGILIFLGIILIPIRAYFFESENIIRAFLLVLYYSVVFKLFISSSYLNEGMLFMLIGLCFSIIQNNKSTRKVYV